MRKFILFLLFLISVAGKAQYVRRYNYTANPSGTCQNSYLAVNTTTKVPFLCIDGWKALGITNSSPSFTNLFLSSIFGFTAGVSGTTTLNSLIEDNDWGSYVDSGNSNNLTISEKGGAGEGVTTARFIMTHGGSLGIRTTPRALLDISTGFLVGTGLELPHIVNKSVSVNVRNSHDAVATHTGDTVYTKAKTITFTNGLVGIQRFLFDIQDSDASTVASGKILYNGTDLLGAEQTDITGSYVTKSQDITKTFNPGDRVELWIKIADGAQTVSVRNFRVAYDDAPTVAVASTISTP